MVRRDAEPWPVEAGDVAWRKENEQTRVEVTREDAYAILEFDIAAPRQAVWETEFCRQHAAPIKADSQRRERTPINISDGPKLRHCGRPT